MVGVVAVAGWWWCVEGGERERSARTTHEHIRSPARSLLERYLKQHNNCHVSQLLWMQVYS